MFAVSASNDSVPSGYRPHLDGLRAVAVVAVILFHLGYVWMPGGFIGVDVFFVLSGYLITGLLVDDAQRHGHVRLRRFYERRMRRLLPASATVLIVVIVAGRLLLDPVQQASLSWDALFASLYSANWRFGLSSGDYFQAGDVPSALVHYWSLGIEEQFYLLWPTLLVLTGWSTRRFDSARRASVLLGLAVGLFVVSAALGVVNAGQPIGYYGLQTRGFQLLAGGALAIGVRRFSRNRIEGRRGVLATTFVALGALGLLAWWAHTIPDAVRYPGWVGIRVTITTVVLIAAVDLSPANVGIARWLGGRVPATIGRLSYSLYIWHWPILVFVPQLVKRLGDDWSWLGLRPVLVVITVAFAAASYHAIEQPFRFRWFPEAPAWRTIAVGLSCSLLVAVGAMAVLRPRDPFKVQALNAVRDLAVSDPCPYFPDDWKTHGFTPCLYRKGSGPTIALVGDSHAQQWQPAIAELAKRSDATIVNATYRGCPANDLTPFWTDDNGRAHVDKPCTEWRRKVFPELVERYDPDVIFVVTYSNSRSFRVDGADVKPTDSDHLAVWAKGWEWTLDTLTGGTGRVLVSTAEPNMPERIPACLIAHGRDSTACDFPLSETKAPDAYNRVIRGFASHSDVGVVDTTPLICPDGTCPAVIDGVIVHRDDDHISASFARHRADDLGALFQQAGVSLE